VSPRESGGGVEVYPGNYEEYLYHLEQQAAAPAASAAASAAAPAGAAPAKGKRVNPQRQQALRNEVAELEAAIAAIEQQIQEQEASLGAQETFRDAARAQAALARFEQLGAKKAELYAAWEQKSAAATAQAG
ncbi:MAG: hypothetical protein ACRD1E_11825, partial [Terriglobales bacterium]